MKNRIKEYFSFNNVAGTKIQNGKLDSITLQLFLNIVCSSLTGLNALNGKYICSLAYELLLKYNKNFQFETVHVQFRIYINNGVMMQLKITFEFICMETISLYKH